MNPYKVICLACIILCISISIFAPCFSNAAIVANTGTGNWPITPSGQITARYGNNAIGGTWELSNNAGDTKQYVWSNGVNVPFTLSHNGSGLTMSLSGGPSTTWNYGWSLPSGVKDIYIRVRTDSASETVTINNLMLNGTPISSSLFAQNSIGFMHIYDDSLVFSVQGFPYFTLTGIINLTWVTSIPPPQIQANFTVANFYSTAAGANTSMIVLIALVAITTGVYLIRHYRQRIYLRN